MPSNITLHAGSESQKKEKKTKKRIRDTDGDGFQLQSQPLLVRCSSSEDKVKIKKKKKQQQQQELIPMTTTITKNISITRTITITTPPEDPENNICLYLCIQKSSDPSGHYRWCKIDPTNQSSKPKSKPMFLSIISYMPTTTPLGFCVVASSDSGPFWKKKKKKHKKVVYAVGGRFSENSDGKSRDYGSTKAFVCDFGSNSLVWEELPPMSSPKIIHFGVVSPSDGKLYAFGNTRKEVEGPKFRSFPTQCGTRIETVAEKDVFNPASCSWAPPPHSYGVPFRGVEDHTFDKEQNELVFTNSRCIHTFSLTTLRWSSRSLKAPLSPWGKSAISSSVVVGDTIYKFHFGQLYALDRTSTSPSFELVPGLHKKVDSYMCNRECLYKSYLSYLGKGKFSLVWGGPSFKAKSPRDSVFISCLKFWVGVCNRTNRRRVLIDQREEYVTNGYFLHDCVAL